MFHCAHAHIRATFSASLTHRWKHNHFRILAVANNTAKSMGGQIISPRGWLYFLWVYTPKWDCWMLTVTLFYIFGGTSVLFFLVAALTDILSVHMPPLSSTSLLTPTFCLFCKSHSNRCEAIPHRGFYLHFPDNWWCRASSHVPVDRLCVFPFMSFIFNWAVGFLLWIQMSFLHILDINPLLDIWSADMSFSSIGCLFILSIVSFAVQKLCGLV